MTTQDARDAETILAGLKRAATHFDAPVIEYLMPEHKQSLNVYLGASGMVYSFHFTSADGRKRQRYFKEANALAEIRAELELKTAREHLEGTPLKHVPADAQARAYAWEP